MIARLYLGFHHMDEAREFVLSTERRWRLVGVRDLAAVLGGR